MYRSLAAMEPMLPAALGQFTDQVLELTQKSAALGRLLPGKTRRSLIKLLATMNSYYSNRIEGHPTHPRDIERALAADFSSDPARRALQLESLAHIAVQQLIDSRLQQEPAPNICSTNFLCWIHEEFYSRMPAEFRVIKDKNGTSHVIEPGRLRGREVQVGRHVPPTFHAIPQFLECFARAYDLTKLSSITKIVAVAASHHRLAWIHPFLDGNGRVTRLFTDAFLRLAGIDGHGLWVVSRGLARRRDDYFAALAWADAPRQGDLDGRGNLSNRSLVDFCRFFFEVCSDQINFMTSLLELETLERRVLGYVNRQVAENLLRKEAGFLLRDILLRGEIPRGEAARITGLGERTARKLLGTLIDKSLLESDSPKGPIRLAFPTAVVAAYFPRLYPEGTEDLDSVT